MLKKWKENREIDSSVVNLLNKEIKEKTNSKESSAKEVFELWEQKQTVKMHRIPIGDVMKIAANVVIVGAIMVFETNHVMNKSVAKFIEPLRLK